MIRAIWVQGFKSFKEEQVFRISPNPGMYLLLGENKSDRDLGANGAGKSTVFDALSWCLFGKTSRGTKGPTLINWDEDYHCQVITDLEVDGTLYRVRRSLKPNSLSIENQTTGEANRATQEDVHDLVGFKWEAFLSCILLGQFTPWFFDLTPAGRLQVLHDALDLGVYERAAALAGEKAKALESQADKIERRLAFIRGELKGAKSNLDMTRKLSRKWKTQHKEDRKVLLERSHQEEDAVKEAEGKVYTLARELEKIEVKSGDIKRTMVAEDDKVRKTDRNLARARGVREGLQRDADRLLIQEEEFPEYGQCPSCRQDISRSHRDREVGIIRKERTLAEEKVQKASQDVSRLEKRLKRYRQTLRDQDRLLNELEDQERKVRRSHRDALGKLSTAKSKQRRTARDLVDLEEAENPHAETIRKIKEGGRELARERDSLKKDLGDLDPESFRFWQKGMKEVRLVVVEEALRQLEIHVNSALVSLGLRKWSITFDIERASASGKSIRGFSTMIQSPRSGGPVPWELWSGGETQRLRIAGALGISTLVRDRLGIDCPLEVWDEPTAHLSIEGVDDLVQTFSERAREEGRQIWMIDHRCPENGNWQGTRTVRKTTKGGSKFVKGRGRNERV